VPAESSGKEALYALDLSDAEWIGAPGSDPGNRVEIARLPQGAVALRNPAIPDSPVLRFDAAEWDAFRLGALDGEFDL
jgi:hypothetical protein